MKNSNELKAEQLGMPWGTAAQRLRKMLLFKFVQELKLDTCFKCGTVIESIDDLSIEHKTPWFNRDAELFWDLDNIAFSHLRCNVRTSPGKTTRISDGENHWCSGHDTMHHSKEFGKNLAVSSGLASNCKKFEAQRVQNYRNRIKPA